MEPLRVSAEATPKQVEPEMLSLLSFDNLTQEYILHMGRSHPEIFQAIQHWQRGDITWEQATYVMIVTLVRSKSNISSEYLKLLDRTPPAPIVVLEDSQFFERAIDLCNSESQKQLLVNAAMPPAPSRSSDEAYNRVEIEKVKLAQDLNYISNSFS